MSADPRRAGGESVAIDVQQSAHRLASRPIEVRGEWPSVWWWLEAVWPGMAAALALQGAGADVTLIEARRVLGGRAGSFEDPASGEMLDNCQHVLLGCCTNLIDFYQRAGVADQIKWESQINFVDPKGNFHALWATRRWPAPLHLAASGMMFGALTFSERIALGKAMGAMMILPPAGRAKLADVSFGDWLAEHSQPDVLIDKFYDIVLVSAQ